MEPSVIFGAVGVVMSVGGIGAWAVRLEGKVKNHETLFEERKKQDELRYAILKEQGDRTEQKVDRIEGKIDTYLLRNVK